MRLCDLVERNEDLEDRNELVQPAHSMLHIAEGQEDMVRLWKTNVLEVPNWDQSDPAVNLRGKSLMMVDGPWHLQEANNSALAYMDADMEELGEASAVVDEVTDSRGYASFAEMRSWKVA